MDKQTAAQSWRPRIRWAGLLTLVILTAAGWAQTPAPVDHPVYPRDIKPWTPSGFENINPKLHTLIIAGDSTAAQGDSRHRGWGAVLIDYFDPNKVNVVNRARGGRSFRSFVREGLWDQLVANIRPGDFVMIQFGWNDGGDINNVKGRADLPGLGDETQVVTRQDVGQETVHTFGWYAHKFVRDVRAKGGTPVIMSMTPASRWRDGKFVRHPGRMYDWLKQVADEEHVLFFDHYRMCADLYEKLGEDGVKPFHPADYLHTSTPGAVALAEQFIAGLKSTPELPLAGDLNDKGKAIPAYRPAAAVQMNQEDSKP